MQADEQGDAPLITPVNYAKIRPITSQLVYYAIRTNKIATYICNCGSRCIRKDEADAYYRMKRGATAWPYGRDDSVER